MRRQKRNQPERAYLRGYQVGIQGRSRTLCPHAAKVVRQSWVNGWREGREDLWSGYSGAAMAEKLARSPTEHGAAPYQ